MAWDRVQLARPTYLANAGIPGPFLNNTETILSVLLRYCPLIEGSNPVCNNLDIAPLIEGSNPVCNNLDIAP